MVWHDTCRKGSSPILICIDKACEVAMQLNLTRLARWFCRSLNVLWAAWAHLAPCLHRTVRAARVGRSSSTSTPPEPRVLNYGGSLTSARARKSGSSGCRRPRRWTRSAGPAVDDFLASATPPRTSLAVSRTTLMPTYAGAAPNLNTVVDVCGPSNAGDGTPTDREM